jgi:hypothetical protein
MAPKAQHSPADPFLRLEDADGDTRLPEPVRRRETGDSASDDEDFSRAGIDRDDRGAARRGESRERDASEPERVPAGRTDGRRASPE